MYKKGIELNYKMQSTTSAGGSTLRHREIPSSISKSSKDLPFISVVIPAFNEEQTVGSVVRRTRKVLQMLVEKYELIVIDDGSTDKTARFALHNGAIVISNGGNLGKGRAIMKGFQEARGNIVITMDGDGANEPEEIPKLLHPVLEGNRVDVVIGSRFKGYIEDDAIPRRNILGNKIINIVLSFILGQRITDSQSGFRVYKRTVVENLFINSSGFEVETEVLLKVFKRDFKVKEIAISCKKRDGTSSKLRFFRDGLRILKAILRYSLAD